MKAISKVVVKEAFPSMAGKQITSSCTVHCSNQCNKINLFGWGFVCCCHAEALRTTQRYIPVGDHYRIGLE